MEPNTALVNKLLQLIANNKVTLESDCYEITIYPKDEDSIKRDASVDKVHIFHAYMRGLVNFNTIRIGRLLEHETAQILHAIQTKFANEQNAAKELALDRFYKL